MPNSDIITKDIDVLGVGLTMGSALDSSAPPSPIMLGLVPPWFGFSVGLNVQ